METKMTFRPFDIAEYLDSPEAAEAFLAVAVEEADGDKNAISRARAIVERSRKLQAEAAK